LFYISGQKEAMQIQIQNLESKVQLLTRSNQMMEGEMSTLKVQIESREKTLKDVEGELQLANSRLELNKSDDRKQQKNDKLTLQVYISTENMTLK
jgi:DNA-binding transcriptional regulator of glucitol operon